MSDEELFHEICARLGIKPRAAPSGWLSALCPFHPDHRPSLRVSRAGYRCFGCGASGSLQELIAALGGGGPAPIIPTPRRRTKMKATKPALIHPPDWLIQHCGVDPGVLKALVDGGHLGFVNTDSERAVAFLWPELPAAKIRQVGTRDFEWRPPGCPKPPLWPRPERPAETLILCESESDAMAMAGLGFKLGEEVVAVTAGASTPPPDTLPAALHRLGVRTIILAFDADGPGRKGSQLWAEALSTKLRVGFLDFSSLLDCLSGMKDLRDVVVGAGDRAQLRQELDRLLAEAVDLADEVEPDEMLPASEVAPDPAEPVIEQLAYRGEVSLLAGPSGVGKSLLALGLAHGLAVAGRFWGRGSGQPEAALYLTSELSVGQVAARLEEIYGERPANLFLQPMPDLWDYEEFARLVKETRARGAGLIILDVAEDGMAVQDENKADQVARRLKRLRQLARKARAAVVALAHTRKPVSDLPQDPAHQVRGSGAAVAKAGLVLVLERLEGNERRLCTAKSWFDEPLDVTFRLEAGRPVLAEAPEPAPSPEQAVLAVFKPKEELSRAEVHQRVGGGFSRATVDRALARLLARRRLVQPAYGRYALPDPDSTGVDKLDKLIKSAGGLSLYQVYQGVPTNPEPAQPADAQSRAAQPVAGDWPGCPHCGSVLGQEDWVKFGDCPKCRKILPAWAGVSPNGR